MHGFLHGLWGHLLELHSSQSSPTLPGSRAPLFRQFVWIESRPLVLPPLCTSCDCVCLFSQATRGERKRKKMGINVCALKTADFSAVKKVTLPWSLTRPCDYCCCRVPCCWAGWTRVTVNNRISLARAAPSPILGAETGAPSPHTCAVRVLAAFESRFLWSASVSKFSRQLIDYHILEPRDSTVLLKL